MKVKGLFLLLLLLGAQAFALKSRQRTFAQNCDEIWKAAVEVAKSQDYRIIAISKEEQVISLTAGGFITGERIISLSLSSRNGDGCVATVQSRFSGLIHSDGPDLLRRIHVEVVGNSMDRNSKAFRHFKACMEGPGTADTKCEERLRKELGKSETRVDSAGALPALPEDWWKNINPTPVKKDEPAK